MSNNGNFNKSIETIQSKESKNYKKSAAYKFAVGVLALSLTVGTLTGCGGDKINATEPNPTQIEDYTEADSTDEATDEGSEVTTSEITNGNTNSTTEATTTESTTSGVTSSETTTAEVVSPEQKFESMYTFKYDLPTDENRIVPSRFSNGELVDYSVPRTYSAEDYNFKYLSPEQQAEIKNMADMSVEDFRKLPLEEQLKYNYWVFENNYQSFELMLDIVEADRDYLWEVKDAAGVINNYACNEIFWRTLISYNNPSGETHDFDAMSKFGSLIYSDEILDGFDKSVEQIKTNGSIPSDMNINLDPGYYGAGDELYPDVVNGQNFTIKVVSTPSDLVNSNLDAYLDFEKVKFTTITGEEAYTYILKSYTMRH